jgi:acetyltransferase-like isoleucine patch superfamily enzyme
MKIKKIFKFPFYVYRFTRDFIFCMFKLGVYDKSWRFHGLPLIQMHDNSQIEIGVKFVACSNPKYNTIGVFQRVMLKTTNVAAVINIGNHVGISGATISSSLSIKIGNNVLIGSGALITDNDAHALNSEQRNNPAFIIQKPIVIEDNCFIGARAIILKGVNIGTGAVVGAGSVVTKNVEPYSIVAGNPAKKIGDVRGGNY